METREPVTALEQIDIESTTLPTPTPASSNIYLLPETSTQCIQLDDQCNSTIDGCVNCCNLQKEIESMKGEVRSLKLKATLLKNKMAKNQQQWVTTFQAIQHVEDTITTPVHIGTTVEKDLLSQTVQVWLCALILDGCKS
ncbi:PREDICTED: uncharacterized protein LOC107338229 [Acropora digitifera]|uniref:uncharacterized protein LOC107338229 n=1 Tax=Acropora digitifera TaxID=70779 RepID=UPI00077A4F52|nr:PREDICTED: uncharacterized protein LOC107338229 [Acropora digitifera]